MAGLVMQAPCLLQAGEVSWRCSTVRRSPTVSFQRGLLGLATVSSTANAF